MAGTIAPWADAAVSVDLGGYKIYGNTGSDGGWECTGTNTVNLTIRTKESDNSTDGDDAICNNVSGAVAVGVEAYAANLATVVGSWAAASAEGAVAIGNGAKSRSANSVVIGRNASADSNALQAVVIGLDASAAGDGGLANEENGMIAIGKGARARGNQATVVGSTAAARRQATAVGNDVFALGGSSIAIGNDDIVSKTYQDKLPTDTIQTIYAKLWASEGTGDMNAPLISYGDAQTSGSFYYKYISEQKKDGTVSDKRMFSPTFAAGLGSIAIGSRTVAGGELSTSVGSLSFALADRSTAVGLRAFVAGPGTINGAKFDGAVGATAIGENSRVFAANSVAIGNNAEASHTGAYAYGYNAKAVGMGSIALGYSTVAGARINQTQYQNLLNTTSYLHGLEIIKADGTTNASNVTTFNSGVNALINGGTINRVTVAGIQAGFTDNVLFEQKGTDGKEIRDGNEYLEVGGKKIYNLQLGDGDGIEVNGNDYSANNGIAIGRYSFSLRENSITMGYGTISDAKSGIALGSYAQISSGAINSAALGVNAYVTGANALALGYSSKALGASSSAIGVGSKASGINSIAFGLAAQATGSGSMAFGNLAQSSLENSMALGYQSRTDYTTVDAGDKPTGATWDALTYEERNKYLSDFNKYAWMPDGKDSIYYISNTKAGIISVGQKLNERRITNLAPGALGTDAVNVDQLKSVYYQLQADLNKSNQQNSLHYLSVSDKGQNANLETQMNLVENYQDYVTKKSMYLSYVARKKLNNENFSQSAMDEMKADIIKMETDNPTFKNTATGLAAFNLDGSSFSSSDSISTVLNNLTNAKDGDLGRTPPGTADIEAERQASNYDNNKAIAEDSIAIGYRASTGNSATGGITVGTKAAVTGAGGVALGQEANSAAQNAIAVGNKANATGAYSIAIGTEHLNLKTRTEGWGAIAIGTKMYAKGGNSIALGVNSKALASKSIVIGSDNNKDVTDDTTTAEFSVVIGNNLTVTGNQSIAIGYKHTVAGNNSGAFGDPDTVNYDNSYVIGNNSTIGASTTTGTETGSFVMGNNANVTADNVFVLGNNITSANLANSVYLGSGSAQVGATNSRALGIAYTPTLFGITYDGGTDAGHATTFAGNNPTSIVTIGNDSTSRLLQGVAAGTISATSTDAINGSQIYPLYSAFNTGLSLKGNFNSAGAMTTYQSMDMKFDLVSGDSAKWWSNGTGSTRYLGNNLSTYIDGTNKQVLIGMRKDPTFESMILRNPEDTTSANGIKFAATANTVTLKQVLSTGADVASGTTNTVKLTNLTNAAINDTSSDAVTGAQLNAIKNIIGGNDYTVTNGIVSAPAVSNGTGGVANTGKSTIDAAIKASQEKVIAKTSQNELVTVTVANEKTADGANQYEVGLNVTNLAKELAKPENGGFANVNLSNITVDGKKAVSSLVSAAAKDSYTSVTTADDAKAGTRTFTIGTNVATTITDEATATTTGNASKVASAQAVYGAVSGAKSDVNLTTDDATILSLTGDKTAGLGSDTFTLTFSKAKLLEALKGNGALDDTFVKVDGSNLPTYSSAASADNSVWNTWRTKLGIGDGVNWFNVNNSTDKTALNYDKTNSGAKGENSVAIGKNVKASGGNTVAIGTDIIATFNGAGGDTAKNASAVLIGYQAGGFVEGSKFGIGDVLIGSGTLGSAEDSVITPSVAIGTRADASGAGATAIGSGAKAQVGKSLALGQGATVATGSLAGSIALGVTSKVTGTVVNGTTAADYLIAGAKDSNGTAITTVAGQDASNAILSVGGGSIKYRQIQNVAPGQVSATSTDAINGSQLYYTNKAVTTLAEKIGDGPINGVDGAIGSKGDPGTPGKDGQPGVPGQAGKDGLNGESLANKVQGLRDGMAGTVVYTDAETGERVLVENGEYYKASTAGALVKANNGLWYLSDRVNSDGTLVDPEDDTGLTLAELAKDKAGSKYDDKSKIMLSAVNSTGDTNNTTTPITLAHIASALGFKSADYTGGLAAADTTYNKVGVYNATTPADSTGLYALKGAALDKAVTLADLQALGLTGLVFGADNSVNDATKAQRVALGGTFNILGDGSSKEADHVGENQYIDTKVTAEGVRITLNENVIKKLDGALTQGNLDTKADRDAENITPADAKLWSGKLEGITYTGDNSSTTAEKKLGTSVAVTGTGDATDSTSANNIVVTVSDEKADPSKTETPNAKLLIQLAKQLTGIESIASGSEDEDAKLTFIKAKNANDEGTAYDDTKPVILANDAVMTGLADGKIAEDSKDAVTGGQLHALSTTVDGKADKTDLTDLGNKTIKLTGDDVETSEVDNSKAISSNPVFKITGNDDITTAATVDGISLSLNKITDLSAAGASTSTLPVTSKAVYDALTAAKPTINGDSYINVDKTAGENGAGDTFNLTFNETAFANNYVTKSTNIYNNGTINANIANTANGGDYFTITDAGHVGYKTETVFIDPANEELGTRTSYVEDSTTSTQPATKIIQLTKGFNLKGDGYVNAYWDPTSLTTPDTLPTLIFEATGAVKDFMEIVRSSGTVPSGQLKYKANASSSPVVSVDAASVGLDFRGEYSPTTTNRNVKISISDQPNFAGVVNFSLDSDLISTTSISSRNTRDVSTDNTANAIIKKQEVKLEFKNGQAGSDLASTKEGTLVLNNRIFDGIKAGKIADNSLNAINGSQLNDLAVTQLGLKVNEAGTGFAPLSFNQVGNNDARNNVKAVIDDLINATSAGIQFNGDTSVTGHATTSVALGSALSVTHAKANAPIVETVSGADNNYRGDNLRVKSDATGVTLGLSEKPVFSELTIGAATTADKANGVTLTATPAVAAAEPNPAKPATLTLAGATPTDKVKLAGLADGTEASDAATVGQLNASIQSISFTATQGTTVVYTLEDGTRVYKEADGFYKAADTSKPYSDSNKTKLTETEKVILSSVGSDGQTVTPITLANIASALGIEADKYKTAALTAETVAKSTSKVSDLIGTTDGTAASGLYALKGADLNKAVTLADLQALGLTGLVFADNAGNTLRRALGTTLNIVGKVDATTGAAVDVSDDAKNYSGDNLATVVNTDNKQIRIQMLKLPHFEGIVLNGKNGDDGTDGKDGFIGVNENGEVVVINGVNGKDGKKGDNGLDGANGSKVLTEDDITGDTATVKLSYKTTDGKGFKADTTDKDDTKASEVTLKTGLDFQNGTNTTAEIGKDGIVKYNLNPVLNNITSIGGGTTGGARITFNNGAAADDDKTPYDDTKPSISMNGARVTDVAAGVDGTDAVNKDQLDAIAEKILGTPIAGKNGKDGINGVDGYGYDGENGVGVPGAQGIPGVPGQQGLVGPAGKDGTGGTTIINKVQALRDGVAGTVVYTDKDGNRVLVENGKYYSANTVTGYQKAADGLWYTEAGLDENGKPNGEEQGLTLADLAKKKDANFDPTDEEGNVAKSDVMLSAVNPDGSTVNSPTTLANIASALGIDPTGNTAGDPHMLNSQAISADVAKKLMNGYTDANSKKQSGLLELNGNALNKATTLADLQAVAQAGIGFLGNQAEAVGLIHRPLGSLLKIQGSSSATWTTANAANYSADNLITHRDSTDTSILRIEMKKTPGFNGIVLNGKDGKPGEKGDDAYITVDSDGNVVVINGTNGTNGKDGSAVTPSDNNKVVTKGDLTGDSATVKLAYKANGAGYTYTDDKGQSQTVSKPEVSLDTGLDFRNGDNTTATVDKDGKVTISVNKDLTDMNSATFTKTEGTEPNTKTSTTKIDGDGITITSKEPGKDEVTVKLTKDGLDNGGNTIKNVAGPENDTDAANKKYVDDAVKGVQGDVDDVKEDITDINKTIDKGLNVATETIDKDGKIVKSTEKLALGDTVKVKAGANVQVSEVKKDTDGTFSYTINVNGIPMSYINSDGETLAKIGDKFYVVKDNGEIDQTKTNTTIAGMKVVNPTEPDKGLTVDNVAAGKVAEGSKQAVNGGQIANILGVKSIDENGKVIDKDGKEGIGGTGKNTVSEAIQEVAKRASVEVANDDGNLTVVKDTSNSDKTIYKVNLSDNLKLKQITIGGNVTMSSSTDDDGTNVLNVGTEKNPTRVRGVADGVNDTDAVNVGQLKRVAANTTQEINKVNKRVDNLTKESRGGIAGAMATAGLVQTTQPGRATVS
ncbi:hypothetical protein, partial [Gallibacterium salpingitidis]|uniref:hypothetical protein n=1 Tax=Gallibacterium salpingitidis TaxID=505341 RepID=UPI0012E7AECB